jgi:hypothetical protein
LTRPIHPVTTQRQTKIPMAYGRRLNRCGRSTEQPADRHRLQQRARVTKIIATTEPAISLEKSPTVVSPDVGGAFSLFGGIIIGRHVELVPDMRIGPGLASGVLASGHLLDCEIRSGRARYWNQDRV